MFSELYLSGINYAPFLRVNSYPIRTRTHENSHVCMLMHMYARALTCIEVRA